jgi:hypothetical protein
LKRIVTVGAPLEAGVRRVLKKNSQSFTAGSESRMGGGSVQGGEHGGEPSPPNLKGQSL